MESSVMESSVDGARRAGEKLVGEVRGEALSSVLASLRQLMRRDAGTNVFGIPELDALLPQPPPAQVGPAQHQLSDDVWALDADGRSATEQQQRSPAKKAGRKEGPILEFVSPPSTHHASGAGKTSLVYLITALAVLPSSIFSMPIAGQTAAIIIFDPLSHFSAARLAEVMVAHIKSKLNAIGKPINTDSEEDETLKNEIRSIVNKSLTHVHVFRPQSWASYLATLKMLPDYLFDGQRHKSMARRIHSIILEDADAFSWSIRAASTLTNANPATTASSRLTTQLLRLSTQFSCSVILTSHSAHSTSFRPFMPVSWPADVTVIRLAVRRVEVVPFAPEISVEDAENDRAQRWEVVKRGRFECCKVGAGGKEESGFIFRIGKGVEVEMDED